MHIIEKYLEFTGDDKGDLMEGTSTYGAAFNENIFVPMAIERSERIVLITELVDGEDVGLVRYDFENI